MYNPGTNTLTTCCICACCDSYHARIVTPAGNTCYAKITLNPDSLGENTAHLTFDVYGTKFELGVREIGSSSTKMSIAYFTKTGDYRITCANVIDANNKNVVYIKYYGYRPINITSDIPIESITKSSTAPSDVSSTSWCAPTYDNATQYVNVTNTNCDFPILFNSCQATPAAGCKTLYNDSANNLMYNPGTNTLTTCTICANTFCGSFCPNGILCLPQGANVPYSRAATANDTAVASGALALDSLTCTKDCRSFIGSIDLQNGTWYNVISIRHKNGSNDGNNYGTLFYQPLTTAGHWCSVQQMYGQWLQSYELIDSTGGQTINGNLTVHNSSNNAVLTADTLKVSEMVCATSLKVRDMTVASSSDTPISLTCGSYKVTVDSRNSIAIGTNVNASGARSIAIGACAKANIVCSIAIGGNANTNVYGAVLTGACILVDERVGEIRRSIICWNTATKQCDLFNAIYCRFNFNLYANCNTVYVSVTGVYDCDTLNEIKWDKNETPKNFDLGRQGFTNAITVYDGCTNPITKAGYVQIVGYAR